MQKYQTIYLAGGCFWCIEAYVQQLRGVVSATSGYMGGHVENPNYQQVCSGTTGHAEAVEVVFDENVVTLHDLLMVFFTLHNPTTLNRQGADVGTQYRSAVFTTSQEQVETVQQVMREVADLGVWEDPLVTTVEPASEWYVAEQYHQDYFTQNGQNQYCQIVISPKVSLLRKQFAQLLG